MEMKLASVVLGLASCAVAAANFSDTKNSGSGGYSSYLNPPRENISDNERALAYSLNLLDKIVEYTSIKANGHTSELQPSEIPLSELGLDSPGSPKKVSNLFDTVHLSFSENYTFTFGDITSTENGVKDMMQMPFDDVFALSPSSISYMSSVLATLSRLDTAHAKSIAPIFGIGSKSIGVPENTGTVASLLRVISELNPTSSSFFAKANIANKGLETTDPLSKHVQLFSLANLAAIDKRRVEMVAGFFKIINSVKETQIADYFHSIGWEIRNDHKQQDDDEYSVSIPSPSIVFLVQDATLGKMAQVASQHSSTTSGSQVEDVKQAVGNNLDNARDLLDLIPGYSSVASLIGLSNSPVIQALTNIISLSYKYPNASYLQLALMYYRSIGMLDLDVIANYPSQYVGGIASSIVGGYVSNVIVDAVTGLLFPFEGAAPTPTSKTSSQAKSTSTSHSQSSTTSTGGGFWNLFSPFDNSNVDTALLPKATPTMSAVTNSKPASGTSIASVSSQITAKHSPYQATLDLNKQTSTRVTYTMSSDMLPTVILTVIPQHS